MSLSLHSLAGAAGSTHRRKRIGRGNASGHGTTATRGTKGQRARQGGRKGLGQLGIKHFVSHIPKVRGFTSLRISPQVIQISDLAGLTAGSVVTGETLVKQKLVRSAQSPVKLIGAAKLSVALNVRVQAITAGARHAIEAAGGTVEIVELPKKTS